MIIDVYEWNENDFLAVLSHFPKMKYTRTIGTRDAYGLSYDYVLEAENKEEINKVFEAWLKFLLKDMDREAKLRILRYAIKKKNLG